MRTRPLASVRIGGEHRNGHRAGRTNCINAAMKGGEHKGEPLGADRPQTIKGRKAMAHSSERRLREGVTVAVHRNAGLRKVCDCPRREGRSALILWHFNYSWQGAPRIASAESIYEQGEHRQERGGDVGRRIRREIRRGHIPGSACPTITNQAVNEIGTKCRSKCSLTDSSSDTARTGGRRPWQDDWYMSSDRILPTIEDGRSAKRPFQRVTETTWRGSSTPDDRKDVRRPLGTTTCN